MFAQISPDGNDTLKEMVLLLTWASESSPASVPITQIRRGLAEIAAPSKCCGPDAPASARPFSACAGGGENSETLQRRPCRRACDLVRRAIPNTWA